MCSETRGCYLQPSESKFLKFDCYGKCQAKQKKKFFLPMASSKSNLKLHGQQTRFLPKLNLLRKFISVLHAHYDEKEKKTCKNNFVQI